MNKTDNFSSLGSNELINFYQQKSKIYSPLIELLIFFKVLSLVLFLLIRITLFVTKLCLPKLSLVSYFLFITFVLSYIIQILIEHYFAVLERKIALKSEIPQV